LANNNHRLKERTINQVPSNMKKLQTIIFQWNYLLTFLLFLVVAVGLVAFSLNVFIDVLGEARVHRLKEVAERSKIINKTAI